MKILSTTLAAALIAVAAGAHAQSTSATSPTIAPPPTTVTPAATGKSIKERKIDQQDRIAQGLKSGQLTATEASALETQEAGINKEEAGMRQQDNGKLTTQDKKTLNKQLTQESRRIRRDEHRTVHHK